jgi:hypothetical protein
VILTKHRDQRKHKNLTCNDLDSYLKDPGLFCFGVLWGRPT